MKKIVSFWIVFLLTIVSAEAAKGPRKFYLTQDFVKGSQALNACAEGYHMASLWEIFDTSNLKYDTTLGTTQDDSGSGPPTGFGGWIRTGYASSGDSLITGRDNCFAWTSDSDADRGTAANLTFAWDSQQATRIDPWDTSLHACLSLLKVWCVQD
jgi:hypothetical protein